MGSPITVMADFLTPYNAEQTAIERRRKFAELLQKQAMQPDQTQIVSGRAVPNSPVQGVAKLAQALMGARGVAQADEASQGLAGRRSEALWAALREMPQARQETTQQEAHGPVMPGQPQPMISQQRTVQPSMQDNAAWLGSLGQIGPEAVSMGGTMLGLQQRQHEGEETRAARLQERIMALEAAAQNAALSREERAARAAEAAQLRQDLQRSQQEFQRGQSESQRAFQADQRRESAADRRSLAGAFQRPVPVTLQDPDNQNATIVIDAASGRKFGSGPKLTDTGKLENKRKFSMRGIGATIAEAESLLTNKAKPPTGSGVGAAYDTAAGWVGMNPAGSVEAQKLKAVGGALVSKMPRMEGPQSDRDVALYKEMAGMVGDASVPIERRVAALEEVKSIWGKYERFNPGTFDDRRSGGVDAPPPGAVQRLP